MQNFKIPNLKSDTSLKVTNTLKSCLASEKRKNYLHNYQKLYRQEYKKHKKRLSLTFDTEEYQSLLFYFSGSDTKITQQLKHTLISHVNNKPIIPKATQEKLNEFVFLIRNIANNTNQIAKQSNFLKSVISSKNVFKQLHALEQSVKEFIERKATHDY